MPDNPSRLASFMKALEPDLCYLCGKTLSKPTDKDHIPLKGLFPPEIRKKHKRTKLITVRVHKACNESYHSDEQYFIYSLYPFAVGTYVGGLRKCPFIRVPALPVEVQNGAPKRI